MSFEKNTSFNIPLSFEPLELNYSYIPSLTESNFDYNNILTDTLKNNPYNLTTGTSNSSWWSNFNDYIKNNFKNGWLDFGKFGLGALNTGFGIYSGLKQLGLAEDQLNFNKNAFNTNLTNSIKSYNNALEDRARSRYAYMTGSASNADDYINQHKL